MDQSEWGRIKNLLQGPCAGWMVAPFQLAAPTPPPTTVPTATTAPPPPPPPAPPPPPPSASVYYANCTAARAAGAAPIYAGEPGYSHKLDRDGDGVACE